MREILDALSHVGIQHVFIGGGEPLLHPEIVDICSYSKHIGMSVSISTNAHLIRGDLLSGLYDAGLTHDFSVSIDGPNEEINSQSRGKGSFAQTLRGMYELARFGKMLWGVNFVSTKLNKGQALQTSLLAKRLGASYFNLILFTPFGRGIRYRDILEMPRAEFLEERKNMDENFPRMGSFYGDVYLYDLANLSNMGFTSYFDDSRFRQVPSGISIDATGVVELTPAKVYLGNCRKEPLRCALERIQTPEVLSQYGEWLIGRRRGVHGIRSAETE